MDEVLSLEIKRGSEQDKHIPPLALRFLAGPTLRLLEVLRRLPRGKDGVTTYEDLMRVTGIRSRATMAKALKEAKTLGAISYDVVRVRGRVVGLRLHWLGIPAATSEEARRLFEAEIRNRVNSLLMRAKELSLGDGDPRKGAEHGNPDPYCA